MASRHARGNAKPKASVPRSREPSKGGGKPKDQSSIPSDSNRNSTQDSKDRSGKNVPVIHSRGKYQGPDSRSRMRKDRIPGKDRGPPERSHSRGHSDYHDRGHHGNPEAPHGAPHTSASYRRSPGREPSRGEERGREVCRKFLRKQCNQGDNCLYYHPPEEVRYGDPQEAWGSQNPSQHSAWFTICQSQRMGKCDRIDCRDFHIPVEDAILFRTRGEVVPHLVDQIVDQSIRMDLDFVCTQPYCKGFLRGECNVMSCQYRHVGQRDFENEVYEALREEMQHLLGPVDYRPPTPLIDSFPIDGVDLQRPSSPPRPRYIEDIGHMDNLRPADDMRAMAPRERFDSPPSRRPRDNFNLEPPMRPHDDFDPQRKRARYPEDFSNDHTRDGSPSRRPRDYGHDMRDMHENPKESDRMVQDIIYLKKLNADLKVDADRKIETLKGDLNKAMQDYHNLQTEIVQTTNAHQAAMKNVMDSNAALMEERHNAQATILNLEKTKGDMRISLDSLIKAALEEKQRLESYEKTNVALNKKLDAVHENFVSEKKKHANTQMDLSDVRKSFSDFKSKVKKMEDENKKLSSDNKKLCSDAKKLSSDNMTLSSDNKSLLLENKKLSSELGEAKTKLRVLQASVEVSQKSRFINNDSYSRDMGRGSRSSETDLREVDDRHEASQGRNPRDLPPRRDASLEGRSQRSEGRRGEPEEREERDLGRRSETGRGDPSRGDRGQRNEARQGDLAGQNDRSRSGELSHRDRPDRGGSRGDRFHRDEDRRNEWKSNSGREDAIDFRNEDPGEDFRWDDMGRRHVDQRGEPERPEHHHQNAPYRGDSIRQGEAKQWESSKRDKPNPSWNQVPNSSWESDMQTMDNLGQGDSITNSVRGYNTTSYNYDHRQDPKPRDVETWPDNWRENQEPWTDNRRDDLKSRGMDTWNDDRREDPKPPEMESWADKMETMMADQWQPHRDPSATSGQMRGPPVQHTDKRETNVSGYRVYL